MKLFMLVPVLIASVVFAVNPKDVGTTPTAAPGQPGTDAFVITEINSFSCSYASMILGLDYVNAEDVILFTDNETGDEQLWVCNPDDGSQVSSIPMTWDTPSPFGIADFYPGGAQPHCNDFGDTMIWYGMSFADSYYNPYESNGRGMDCDGTYIWEAYGPPTATYGACLGMLPDGTGASAYNLPGITTQLSGLTVYPIPGSLGIAVTAYQNSAADHYIWFYEFNGSSMILLGSAELPTCNSSYGLSYSENRDTYFWSWGDGSTFYISELEITETSLQRETWGAIKSSF